MCCIGQVAIHMKYRFYFIHCESFPITPHRPLTLRLEKINEKIWKTKILSSSVCVCVCVLEGKWDADQDFDGDDKIVAASKEWIDEEKL